METTFFEWDSFKEKYGLPDFSAMVLDDGFFIDMEQQIICLSRKLSTSLFNGGEEAAAQLSFAEFEEFLSEQSRELLTADMSRLEGEKSFRTDSRVNFVIQGEEIAGLIILVKMPEQPYIVGLVHLCHELLHEYEQKLDTIVSQLEEAQNINQLILEGSTDYIYQLDLVNNICTFSPKAMDVLPLDTPTFSNAMDKVLSFIVPEDRNIFLESFTPFLTGKSVYHTAEYRVNTKQGDIMWISCHGKGLHDAEGRPVMIAGSLMDVTEKKRWEDRVNKMLYYDIRTGLKNRYCYEKEVAEYTKRGEKGSIVCIDIRNFKLFNEIFGHNFGNKILKEMADMLEMYLPKSLGIYRLDGDEFLIHLDQYEEDKILERLTPLQMALSKARILDGHSIYIDVTIGVAIYPKHGTTPEELLKNADTVLYRMSKYSNEKVMFFIDENGMNLSKRYTLESELRNDIENHFAHFRVVYQPIVRLEKDGTYWCAAEALLRYRNPELPDVTQMELIETLEMSDLIIPVGRWVMSQALKECSQWQKTGAYVPVHVNFSAQQLSDAGILNYTKELLHKYQIEPCYLVCELTETSLINNFETATRLCRNWMEMGIGIALDDFGTGYSSFNYLRNLPISQIKIDKAYVQELHKDDYNKIIISCLYDLSRNMNLELCVEGIETKETLDLLAQMGVKLIQGFYFERPLEAEIIRKEFSQHV